MTTTGPATGGPSDPVTGSRLPAEAYDIAWRTHDALRDWTANVDGKATFALTLESALLGAVAVLSSKDGQFSQLRECALGVYRGGIALLTLATLCAVAAVIPQIRARPTKREWETNFVFFGHVRRWTATSLVAAWESRDVMSVLAAQAIAMSKIAWRKHRLLQASLGLAVLGTGLLAVAAMLK